MHSSQKLLPQPDKGDFAPSCILPCKIGGSQNLMKERYLSKKPFLTFVYISKCNKKMPCFFGNSKKMFLWTGPMIIHTFERKFWLQNGLVQWRFNAFETVVIWQFAVTFPTKGLEYINSIEYKLKKLAHPTWKIARTCVRRPCIKFTIVVELIRCRPNFCFLLLLQV